MATARYATYKGRTYLLRFLGTTKFGLKAKLAFLDGSKEFWVDSNLIAETNAPPTSASASSSNGRSSRRRLSDDDRCEACGGNKWTCGHCVGW